MKITGDDRIISHFYNEENKVYTILFPPTDDLSQRYDILQEVCTVIKTKIDEVAAKAKEEAEAPQEKCEVLETLDEEIKDELENQEEL